MSKCERGQTAEKTGCTPAENAPGQSAPARPAAPAEQPAPVTSPKAELPAGKPSARPSTPDELETASPFESAPELGADLINAAVESGDRGQGKRIAADLKSLTSFDVAGLDQRTGFVASFAQQHGLSEDPAVHDGLRKFFDLASRQNDLGVIGGIKFDFAKAKLSKLGVPEKVISEIQNRAGEKIGRHIANTQRLAESARIWISEQMGFLHLGRSLDNKEIQELEKAGFKRRTK